MPYLQKALMHKCLILSSPLSLASPPTKKSRLSSANCRPISWPFPVHGDTARVI
jgi:hypothetical protein